MRRGSVGSAGRIFSGRLLGQIVYQANPLEPAVLGLPSIHPNSRGQSEAGD
jgi:hypothetical protein